MVAQRNLSIYRGDDYSHEVTVLHSEASAADLPGIDAGDPVDLSDRTWAAQIRRAPDGPDPVAFTVDPASAADGVLLLTLTAAQTTTLPRAGVWDLEGTYTADGLVETLLAGSVVCTRDVTR
jgi:hypothetical protein